MFNFYKTPLSQCHEIVDKCQRDIFGLTPLRCIECDTCRKKLQGLNKIYRHQKHLFWGGVYQCGLTTHLILGETKENVALSVTPE